MLIGNEGPDSATNVFVYSIFTAFWKDNRYGFASAMSVVLFHYTTRFGQTFGHPSAPTLSFDSGFRGVDLFFMISGFVIFMTLGQTSRASDFVVSRFSRLYPTFWVCVLITFAAVAIAGLPGKEVSPLELLANFTMLPQLLRAKPVDGTYWTLEIELFFYTIMLGLFRLGWLRRVHAVLIAWLGLRVLSVAAEASGMHVSYLLTHVLILPHISLFGAGMIMTRGCASRLLVLDGNTERPVDARFRDLLELLQPGDLRVDTEVVAHLARGLNDLLAQAAMPREKVLGVGISLPGLVERSGGVSVFAPNWDWHDVPLPAGYRIALARDGEEALARARVATVRAAGAAWALELAAAHGEGRVQVVGEGQGAPHVVLVIGVREEVVPGLVSEGAHLDAAQRLTGDPPEQGAHRRASDLVAEALQHGVLQLPGRGEQLEDLVVEERAGLLADGLEQIAAALVGDEIVDDQVGEGRRLTEARGEDLRGLQGADERARDDAVEALVRERRARELGLPAPAAREPGVGAIVHSVLAVPNEDDGARSHGDMLAQPAPRASAFCEPRDGLAPGDDRTTTPRSAPPRPP